MNLPVSAPREGLDLSVFSVKGLLSRRHTGDLASWDVFTFSSFLRVTLTSINSLLSLFQSEGMEKGQRNKSKADTGSQTLLL